MSAVVSISSNGTNICERICLLLFVFILLVLNSKCSAESSFYWFGFSEDGGDKPEDGSSWLSWIPILSKNTRPKPVQQKSFLQQWTQMILGALETAKKHISLLGLSLWSCIVYCLDLIYSIFATAWRTLLNFESWRLLFIFLVIFLLTLTAIFLVVFSKRNKKLGRRLSDVVGRLALTSRRKLSNAQFEESSACRQVRLLIRATLWLVVGAAALSIPWEFIRLYQKEQAKRAARVYAGLPPDCEPSKLTLWQTVKSGLRWHFSWADHNPCERYYHAVLVDPIWEVTPMMVLSSVVARCVLHPLELFSSSMGRSLKLFFTQIPSQWQPVIMVIILVTFLVFLLMTCRYRIRMPMFFVFEPRTPTSNHVKSRRQCVIKAPTVGKSSGQGSKLVRDSGSRKSKRKKDPVYIPDSD